MQRPRPLYLGLLGIVFCDGAGPWTVAPIICLSDITIYTIKLMSNQLYGNAFNESIH